MNIVKQRFRLLQQTNRESLWYRSTQVSKKSVLLFYILAFFVVIAFIDIPGTQISITAPLFLMLIADVLSTSLRRSFKDYQAWMWLAGAIWFGILLSFLVNVSDDFKALLIVAHYAFWMVVFVVCAYVVSEAQIGPQLVVVLAASITLLALFRWFEAFAFGKVGAASMPFLMLQNTYGLMFSTYSAFLYGALTHSRWTHRILGLAGLVVLWGAAGINGSRGSWIAMTAGLFMFVFIYSVSNLKRAMGFVLPLTLLFGLLVLLFFVTNNRFLGMTERLVTLRSLDRDKSFMERQVLNQKSLRLFMQSPWFGIGPGQYKEAYVSLDLPEVFARRHEPIINRRPPHNSYLGLLAETGLAGSIPVAFLLIVITPRGFLATTKLTGKGQPWAAAVFASFFSMSIHLWANAALTNTGTWFVYGFVVATIITAHNQKRLPQCRNADTSLGLAIHSAIQPVKRQRSRLRLV